VSRLPSVSIVAAAVALVLAPLPPELVERWYSRGAYPHLQRALTGLSNPVPFSLFDLVWVSALAAAAVLVYRSIARFGWIRGAAHITAHLLVAAALVYLAFLGTWGLNYRRVPMIDKVAFDPARITPAAQADLAARTVAELNRLYAPAHRTPASLDDLARAFHDAQAALGERVPIVPGRPKPTLLGGYFHQTSIAGMTDPFFLEITLAPDLIDVERPFVIAHEWGHLAGYADESEASFIAWLACMRAGEAAQYSAWLALVGHIGSIPRDPRLTVGPRIDLLTIQTRYRHANELLRFAASQSYDKYLKANRVSAGIRSYDAVLQLILGTGFDGGWRPRLK
jgi:uncharacterized protein DUF3810